MKTAMKTRFACSALMLLLGLAVFAAGTGVRSAPTAHAAAFRGNTAGSISGTVENGTHGNATLTGQTVTLQASVNNGKVQNAASTTTDTQGHFSFTGLDTSGDTIYALDTRFQGGDFNSGALSFDSGAVQQANLTVYDTTSSDAALSVSVATILFSEPNKKAGLIHLGEFVSFKNSGKTAFVGSTAPANGMPMGLLRFSLPDGATNLTVDQGFANSQIIQVPTGFGATTTVPPGSTQFAFAYDVPYTSTAYPFQYKPEYATSQVVVLVPTDMLTDARDFTAKPPVDALGQKYQLLEADNVKSGTQLSTRIWDLPLPGEQPDLDFRLLFAFAGVLALALAALLGLYVKRGNLAIALGLLPASAFEPKTAASRTQVRQQRDVERKRLLKALLALDNQHAAGNVDAAHYERRRLELRGKLKALLLTESEHAEKADTPAADEASRPTHDAAQRERSQAPQSRKRQTVGGRR